MRTELRHGALAGLAGGAALAAVLLVAGEGPLQTAIDLEPGGGEEVISRAGQRVGGVVAALLVGVALGLVLAVAVTVLRRRRSGDAWPTSLGLAAGAFAILQLVPFLKYPPNPPGVGDSASVGRRTMLYAVLLGWSLLSAWAGWRARRWLAGRGAPPHLATPAAIATAGVLVLFAVAVLPAGPDPDAVPASVVWSFRVASLGGWCAYWAVAGTVFAWLSMPGTLRRTRPFDSLGAGPQREEAAPRP